MHTHDSYESSFLTWFLWYSEIFLPSGMVWLVLGIAIWTSWITFKKWVKGVWEMINTFLLLLPIKCRPPSGIFRTVIKPVWQAAKCIHSYSADYKYEVGLIFISAHQSLFWIPPGFYFPQESGAVCSRFLLHLGWRSTGDSVFCYVGLCVFGRDPILCLVWDLEVETLGWRWGC